MKITLEMPDNTICMFLSFILDDGMQKMSMQTNGIDSKEMFDGNYIVIEKKEINHDQEKIWRVNNTGDKGRGS